MHVLLKGCEVSVFIGVNRALEGRVFCRSLTLAMAPEPGLHLSFSRCVCSFTVLLAVLEESIVFATIWPRVNTLALHLICFPATNVGLPIGPHDLTLSTEHVVFKVAFVDPTIRPLEGSITVLLIVPPISFVEESLRIQKATFAIGHVHLPPALVHRTVS